jgi:hypothetical protein
VSSASTKASDKLERALKYLLLTGPLSSYKLALEADIPFATAWRVLKVFSTKGYVLKEGKTFKITPKGVIALYRSCSDRATKIKALEALKEAWGYEGGVDDLRELLDWLLSEAEDLGLDLDGLCFNRPEALAGFLYRFAEAMPEGARRVVAYFLVSLLPSIVLNGSCRGILSLDERGRPCWIAVRCPKHGYRLNFACDEIPKVAAFGSEAPAPGR